MWFGCGLLGGCVLTILADVVDLARYVRLVCCGIALLLLLLLQLLLASGGSGDGSGMPAEWLEPSPPHSLCRLHHRLMSRCRPCCWNQCSFRLLDDIRTSSTLLPPALSHVFSTEPGSQTFRASFAQLPSQLCLRRISSNGSRTQQEDDQHCSMFDHWR
jgi:hypothetical protein